MLDEFNAAIASDNKRKLRKANAFNKDLRAQIHADIHRAIEQTKRVAPRFAGSSIYESCANVHRFLRSNIIYLRDPSHRQEIQLPSSLLRRLTGDCKSYSVFAFAILHNLQLPKVRFKYASYPDELGNGSRIPSHIYVVADAASSSPVVVDGTCPAFNYEKQPFHSFTANPMRVYTISGQGDVLANEILASEVLSSEAAEKFATRLKSMDKGKRKNYLKQFTKANRMKLLRSVKSFLKEKQLKMQGVNDSPFDWEQDAASDYIAGNRSVNDEVLAGKKAKKRRAARKEKKAAKAKPGSNKAKRLTTKAAILKAKATGDKGALKAARKERRARIKENAKKAGKVFAKINPVMALGRGAFLGLVATNVRGFATNMAAIEKENAPLKKKWAAIGGKWDRLQKAINKGKKKKALLGNKLSDEVLAGLGQIETGAAIAAASAVIGAIIPVVAGILKKKGKPAAAAALDGVANLAKSAANKLTATGETAYQNFANKVEDFVEEHPALEDAIETGKDIYTDKLEDLGSKETIKMTPEAEKEEFEENPEVTDRDTYIEENNLPKDYFTLSIKERKEAWNKAKAAENESDGLPWGKILLGGGLIYGISKLSKAA